MYNNLLQFPNDDLLDFLYRIVEVLFGWFHPRHIPATFYTGYCLSQMILLYYGQPVDGGTRLLETVFGVSWQALTVTFAIAGIFCWKPDLHSGIYISLIAPMVAYAMVMQYGTITGDLGIIGWRVVGAYFSTITVSVAGAIVLFKRHEAAEAKYRENAEDLAKVQAGMKLSVRYNATRE